MYCQRFWSGMSKQLEKKEKQQWAVEKPKLDNARVLRGICVIDLEERDLKETMKKLTGKLELHLKQPCFVRSIIACAAKFAAHQSMHASWMLRNPRESVWKEPYPKVMKIALQERSSIRQVITILRTCLSPSLKQCKYRIRKQWWAKNGKAREIASMASDQRN